MDRKPRLWPAVLLGILAAVLLVRIWLGSADSSAQIRQEKVMATAAVLALSAVGLLLWALLFSRLTPRARARVALFCLLAVGLFFATVRYRGVSGDLVPQFELRFRSSGTAPSDGVAPSDLAGAGDFPQFLGAERNAHVIGVDLDRDWEQRPPRVVWRRPVGGGWSGFAVEGEAAITQEQHSAEERVVRYELSTGRMVWATREVAHYENALAGAGPRATPTIHEGRVYAMGATGLLTVLDLETGELLWKKDVIREHGGEVPVWGKSDSPLILDDLVVVGAGAALVAYRAEDGTLAWESRGTRPAYGSPLVTTIAGVRQLVSFNADSLTGHDPEEGGVLWRVDWPRQQPNVAQPLLLPGDRLLASAGYGVGAKLFQLSAGGEGLQAELLWESPRLKAKFANLVFHDGFVYGLDDGVMVCLDPENGRRRWKRGRYGHGQLLLVKADETSAPLLLVQGEHGDIVLVDPSPDELRELGRFTVMSEKVWNSPALAGRYLLVRNDAEAALVELPTVETAASAR